MSRTFIHDSPCGLCGLLLATILILCACRTERPQPSARPVRILNQWLDSSHQSPVASISEKFEPGGTLILVEENILRRDTIDLVKALVPLLYNLGINTIGMHHLMVSSQPELDNPGIADLSKMPVFQFLEYRDFFQYIQDFNSQRPSDTPTMELVALSEHAGISMTRIRRLLGEGNVFLWLEPDDVESIDVSKTVKREPGPLILTHYGPLAGRLRWDGLIEFVKKQRAIRDGTFGFDPNDIPFSFWKYENPVNPNIVIVTGFPYGSVTVVPHILAQWNVMNALRLFPEIEIRKPQNLSATRMDRIIRRQVKRYRRMLDRL